MVKYILTRIVLIFVVIFIVMTIMFFISYYAMLHYWSPPPKPTSSEIMKAVYIQYIEYIKRIVTEWNWGYSFRSREPAWQ